MGDIGMNMDKRAGIALLCVFLFLAVVVFSSVNAVDVSKKSEVSPLFGVRANRANGEKVDKVLSFFDKGDRIYLLPLLKNFALNKIVLATSWTNTGCGCHWRTECSGRCLTHK